MATEDTAPVADQEAPDEAPEDLVIHDPSTDEGDSDDQAEAEESESAEDDTSEDTDKESDDSSDEEAKTEEAESTEEDNSETDSDQKEQARQRYLERQSRRRTQDPYVDSIRNEAAEQLAQIEDDQQRTIAELQVKDRLREIQDARTELITDNEFAQRDFDVFNPKSDTFNEAAYDHFLQEYEAAYVVKDQRTGEVLGTRGPSLYQYLEQKADIVSNIAQTGARRESTAQAKTRAQAFTPSAARPKSTGNALDDLEARLGDIELT